MNRLGATVLLFVSLARAPWALGEAGDFGGYEIRVIRPRYMAKQGRLELGGQGSVIMNQSFIYTFMASGLLDYHLNESFALEVGGAYGFSIDKEDKRILKDKFNITTTLLRTQYMAGGGLLWTPIYGKTQLPSGYVVYFDNFISVQAGMTGINYDFEQCDEKDGPKPAAKTMTYPGVSAGVGQKYFVSQDSAIRFDARYHIFSYGSADGACNPDSENRPLTQQNITLQLGASTFF